MPADDFAILDAEKELGGDLHQHVELRETRRERSAFLMSFISENPRSHDAESIVSDKYRAMRIENVGNVTALSLVKNTEMVSLTFNGRSSVVFVSRNHVQSHVSLQTKGRQ